MNEDHNQQQDDTLEFSSLNLFDDDPLSPDINLLEPQAQTHCYHPHLIRAEELLSESHFKVAMEADCRKGKGVYELVVSSYRLILFQIQLENDKEGTFKFPISLPYGFIEQVDLIKKQIVVILKTGLVYRIKPYNQLKNIYQIILYGFTYIPFFTKNIIEDEPSNYDSLAELERMRIPWEKYIIIPNLNGHLSPTYPKYFIIAKSIPESLLEECIKVRNHGRIPALTYFHADYGVGLWRSARPKINQEGNKYNKAYLKEISRDVVVIDLRDDEPNGKEKESKEEVISRRFETLPALHELYRRIWTAYTKEEAVFKMIGKLYDDVYQLLQTAYLVIEHLQKGKEVLLQEQHGFDRVAQVAALAQLIIDPFYRTLHGFSLLIQKEFISFGHPFARRLGFQRQKITESSPVYVQFLQCVNQLLATHPKCFQFSSFYLARIAYEAYSTKYNNFFFNSQKHRLSSKFAPKTASIWKMPMRKEFYNYQWEEKDAIKPLIAIRKCPSIKEFLMWREYYDLVASMDCEYAQQVNVRQRKNSIYKILHRCNSKQY